MKRILLGAAVLVLTALSGTASPGKTTPAGDPANLPPRAGDNPAAGADTPALVVAPAIARDTTLAVTLAAVGDVMLARSVGQRVLADGARTVFADTREVLAGADITVANLESAVGTRGEPAAKGYRFRAPPATADALTDAGFDVVALANNHTLDYGAEALVETLALLDARGVGHAGAGLDAATAHRAAVVVRNGLRVAFLSYVDVPSEGNFNRANWAATEDRPGVVWFDEAAMRRDVETARSRADIVLVFLHFGAEGSVVPTRKQRSQAQSAIDAGAALVLGSHPHVLQPVEEYNGGVIAYSLGNFVFDGFEGSANDTAIFIAELTREGVQSWRMVTASIGFDGLPRLTGE